MIKLLTSTVFTLILSTLSVIYFPLVLPVIAETETCLVIGNHPGAAVHIRSRPEITSSIITTVKVGDPVTPTGNRQNGWAEIIVTDSTLGWIASQHLNC